MFGSIDIKARPLKFAYLVDPNNSKQVKKAIQLSSSLWGGMYFPIIPLYNKTPLIWKDGSSKSQKAKDIIIGYIEAFDPDILVQFSNNVPKYISDLGLKIIKPNDIWHSLKEVNTITPKFGLGIFELLNEIFKEHFKYKQKYPIKLIFPKYPKQFSLFWASWFGEIPPELSHILKKRYSEPLEIEERKFDLGNLSKILAGNVFFPRRITQLLLNPRSRSGIRKDAYVYFLNASKTQDIIDFWNLRAVGKHVFPLPKQFKDNPHLRELLIEFLKSNRRHWSHNPAICDTASIVRGRYSTMEEIKEYVKTLKIEHESNDPSKDYFFSLQHWYPRIWDTWARDKDGVDPSDIFSEEEHSIDINETKNLRFRFKPLLPSFADKYSYYSEPRCANEFSFRFYSSDEFLAEVFPKSVGTNFNRAISGIASMHDEWRIGKNGLVKLVKHTYSETREIPSSENILFSWLIDLGWRPKLSPPGLVAKQIYRKIEGYVGILHNEKLLGLLEHMNGGSVKRDGSFLENNQINQERDLPVGEVKNRIDSPDGSRYPYLLSKGLFKLGLRIKCPNCIRNFWVSLKDVRNTFTCPKCQAIFPAINNIESAIWSYKTAGPFSIPNYADGAYSVLLALHFFSDRNFPTLRTTPVTSFIADGDGKKHIEADFAIFWEESFLGEKKQGLLFGECKTYGKFIKKDFDRMRYLAKLFPGAILVFCTLRKSLSKSEIINITRITKTGRKYWKPERPINPVLILTGTELLTYDSPPYCWDNILKEKFNRVRDLLSLSNATQQIYLGLRSWEVEWHEKWEKKYRQLRPKKEL